MTDPLDLAGKLFGEEPGWQTPGITSCEGEVAPVVQRHSAEVDGAWHAMRRLAHGLPSGSGAIDPEMTAEVVRRARRKIALPLTGRLRGSARR